MQRTLRISPAIPPFQMESPETVDSAAEMALIPPVLRVNSFAHMVEQRRDTGGEDSFLIHFATPGFDAESGENLFGTDLPFFSVRWLAADWRVRSRRPEQR